MDATISVAELPASNGARWLRDAFRLFRQKPLAWIALSAGWLLITFGLLIVPIIGMALANLMQPAFFASFAIAAYRQAAGEPVMMGDLFLGFRRNLRALIGVGFVLLLAEIAIFALMALMGLPMVPEGDKTFTAAEYVLGHEWIIAVGFLVSAIVKGALWFAPALIAFQAMSATHAMRWSLYAALSNIGAMMVYGACLLGLLFAGALPYMLGMLVVAPMMVISTYTGYRDVFERSPAPGTHPGDAPRT